MPTQYLIFTAPINPAGAGKISAAVADAINDQTIVDICLCLSTGGGHVPEGIAVYNLLKASPKPVTVLGMGNIDSIGITVMLGARKRYAAPTCRFVFHPLGFDTGPARYDIRSLTARVAAMTSDQNRLMAIYKDRTSINDGDLAELFADEHMHNNAWAIQHGFIHGERELAIPAGMPIRNLN